MATESNQPEIYETCAAKARGFVERMDKVMQKVPHLSDAWRELSSITDWARAELISLYYWHDFYKAKFDARPPETLTFGELAILESCVSVCMGLSPGGTELERILHKLERMSKAARAATSCEEAAGQLG